MKNLKVSHRMYLGFTASNLRVGGSFESMLSNPPGVGPSGAAEIGEREVDFFFQHGVCVDSESQRGISMEDREAKGPTREAVTAALAVRPVGSIIPAEGR
jgi:hypothetical protein